MGEKKGLSYRKQVDFDKVDKVESGWDNDEGGKEESDFW